MKTDNPFFSIVIPAYNAARHIEQTILAVIAQTYENWELIVVDDCSKDNTRELVTMLRSRDPRINLLVAPSNFGGPAGPRNMGICHSRGQYVALLDADDIWRSNKLEEVYDRAKTGQQDIYYHREKRFCYQPDETDEEIRTADVENIQNVYFFLLKRANVFSPSAMIIRKSVLMQYQFDESPALHGVEDFDLWLRLARAGFRFHFLDEVLGFYRIHPEGISRNFIKHGVKERTLIKRAFSEFSLASTPGMIATKKYKLLRSLAGNIFNTIKSGNKLDWQFYFIEFLKICGDFL